MQGPTQRDFDNLYTNSLSTSTVVAYATTKNTHTNPQHPSQIQVSQHLSAYGNSAPIIFIFERVWGAARLFESVRANAASGTTRSQVGGGTSFDGYHSQGDP